MKIVVIFGSHRRTGQTMKVCQLFEAEVKKLAKEFVKAFKGDRSPQPKWFSFFVFRSARTFYKYAGENNKDLNYYKDNGWLESDYYYPVKLGISRKVFGKLLDIFNKRMALKTKKK